MQASPLASWVSMDGIRKGFSKLYIDQMTLKLGKGSLTLQDVALSPQWLKIMMGEWVVDVEGEMENQAFALTVRQEDQTLRIKGVDLQLPASFLSTWLSTKMSVQLAGDLRLQGDIGLQLQTMQPLSGALEITWSHASAGVAGMQQPLGSYQGQILSGDTAWEWHVSGGDAVAIKGDGLLQNSGVKWADWSISGSLDVQAQGAAASLMTAVAGSQHAKLNLQGTVNAPSLRWQAVR
ncbi:MAG: hypothetical protein R8M38_08325 [Mariprofundaceae bacterium]